MNSRNRNKNLEEIAKRDGGLICFIGGEILDRQDARIDHWDNNNSNNKLENLHILCPSMNSVKNPRRHDKRYKVLSPIYGNMYERMCDNVRLHTNSIEIIKNMQAEPDFKHWLFYKIVHDDRIFFEDALDGGAAFARCSQETIRRYIKKEVSEVRIYRQLEDPDTHKKLIMLKPEWETFRTKIEEKKQMNKVVRNWKKVMNEEVYPPLIINQQSEGRDEENAGK
jgi:hypothetical protein